MTQATFALSNLLSNDAVHVWRASLGTLAGLPAVLATLAEGERIRAARFHSTRDREHFVASRGLLRTILARYLGAQPADLSLSYGPRGKPALSAEMNVGDLRFNLTHSRGLALYAVTRGREVGVDIEYVDPRLEEGIAERFFSPREADALRALPPAARREAFYACWTRKEAYLKARGDGLAIGLDRFDVSLVPGEPAALLHAEDHLDEGRWSVAALDVGPRYAAALCVEGPHLPAVAVMAFTHYTDWPCSRV